MAMNWYKRAMERIVFDDFKKPVTHHTPLECISGDYAAQMKGVGYDEIQIIILAPEPTPVLYGSLQYNKDGKSWNDTKEFRASKRQPARLSAQFKMPPEIREQFNPRNQLTRHGDGFKLTVEDLDPALKGAPAPALMRTRRRRWQ